MRTVVTGAAGQLGGAIVERFAGLGEVHPLTRRELDVTRDDAVRETIAALKPALVVNCTAYNHVDGAEDDPLAALETNAFAVRSLARAAGRAGAVFVHYSTDFVFEGDANRPYTEEDEANPQSVYGASKLLGEWLAREAPQHYVLRVESLFGGRQARSSIDRIIDALIEDREAPVFTDRIVTPSYVDDVAEATWQLVQRNLPVGLYHCVNAGETTWYELGREIARQLGRPGRLRPVSVSEVRMRARRPTYCALSTERLEAVGIAMPPWQEALKRYLARRGVLTAGSSS